RTEGLVGQDSATRRHGPRGETIELNKRAQVDRSYAAWVKEFDTIGGRERIVIRRQLRALSSLPLISIVLPAYNPALALVAAAINSHPAAGLIYSDEDKIDENGQRCRPYFKSDWNPELLLGQNCVSHLGVYRHTVVREVGGFREGLEGSQDYDLTLR